MKNFLLYTRILANFIISIITFYLALSFSFNTILINFILIAVALFIFMQTLGIIDKINGYNNTNTGLPENNNNNQINTSIPDNNENQQKNITENNQEVIDLPQQDDDEDDIRFIIDKNPSHDTINSLESTTDSESYYDIINKKDDYPEIPE